MIDDYAKAGYTISPATVGDASFIAKATLYAERAHLDVGMWDVYFEGESEKNMLQCLEECAAAVEESHLHFRHFLIARSKRDGLPVSSCSSYLAPTSAIKTFDCLQDVTSRLIQWSEERFKTARSSVEFLCCPEPWPDLDIYAGSSYLETVYTIPAFRGQGVASALLQQHIEKSKAGGAARCFLLCALGNEGACRMYNKQGLVEVGRHVHGDTMRKLGIDGFHVLVREFEENKQQQPKSSVGGLP